MKRGIITALLLLQGASLILSYSEEVRNDTYGENETEDSGESIQRNENYPAPGNLTSFITSLFGISSRPLWTTPPPRDFEDYEAPPTSPRSNNTTSGTSTSKKSRSAVPNPFNITFDDHGIDYYFDLLKNNVSFNDQLVFLDSLSDVMRAEGKFLSEDAVLQFGDLLSWTLEEHHKDISTNGSRNSTNIGAWSKKTERKNIKRFLKYALNIDPEKVIGRRMTSLQEGCETHVANFRFLSKGFYKSLLTHTENEGYEVLTETLQLRNTTLSVEQFQDVQCLYYNMFGGMRGGKSYVFNIYDQEWETRNDIFGKSVFVQSVQRIVEEAIVTDDDSRGRRRMSPDMMRVLSVFSDFIKKAEEEKSREARRMPLQFHKLVQRLQSKFAAVRRTNHFIEVEGKDLILTTVLETVMNHTKLQSRSLTNDRTNVIFSPDSRQDWNALQMLRLAGEGIFDQYEAFFKPVIDNRITEIYSNGGGLRHLFANTMRHIRLLPSGSMILQGCETLQRLMQRLPPRDAEASKARIQNFGQVVPFLQGLYSRDDAKVHALSEQVQILTEPGVNKYLKLMLILPSDNSSVDTSFAEVGVRKHQGQTELVVIPISADRDDEDFSNVQTLWQFYLGYAKSSFESWLEPIIKMKIMLADDYDGELALDKVKQEMTYNSGFDEGDGFWDLSLATGNMSFQLIHHDGLESFFYIQEEERGNLTAPVRIKSKHFMMHQVPASFKPAQFFVVPADL